MKDSLSFIYVLLAVVGFGFVFAVAVSGTSRFDSYKQHCVESGGHIYQPTSSSPAFCLDDDGHMIEVYP